jgi:hypothetical protein
MQTDGDKRKIIRKLSTKKIGLFVRLVKRKMEKRKFERVRCLNFGS